MKKRENLALVLSGGGARGMAHIGVIKVLEKNNIVPNVTIGTSAGALVGGMYAANSLSNFESALLGENKSNLHHILRFWPTGDGFINTKRLEKELRNIIGTKKIEELDKKFVAITVDILTGKKILLDKDDLCNAILGSIAIPMLFPPLHKQDMLLVDGGLEDPLPIDIGFKFAKKVIAVNTIPALDKLPKKTKYNFIDILERASAIIQLEITEFALKKYKKNLVVIQPEVVLETLAFEKAKEAIAIGEAEAEKHVEEIKKLIFEV